MTNRVKVIIVDTNDVMLDQFHIESKGENVNQMANRVRDILGMRYDIPEDDEG